MLRRPDVAGLERNERLGPQPAPRHRGHQSLFRLEPRFVRELKRAPVKPERLARAAVDHCLHGFVWIHVLVLHEPARLVGADWKKREIDRRVSLFEISKYP